MKTVTLNNGVEMPIFGLGTFPLRKREGIDAFLMAFDMGYRLIDTARYYQNEDAVGQALAETSVPREEIFVTTKIYHHDYENCYEAACDSLKTLQTDYVDLLLLHWPFGNYYKAWRDLERIYKEGKARAIGVSNFNPDRLVDLIYNNEIKPAVNQVETNIYCQRKDMKGWFVRLGVQQEAYSPLSRIGEFKKHPIIKSLCEKYNKSASQIALNFIVSQGIVAISKSGNKERMKENLEIFDFSLTENERLLIETLNREAPLCGNPENIETAFASGTWPKKMFDD